MSQFRLMALDRILALTPENSDLGFLEQPSNGTPDLSTVLYGQGCPEHKVDVYVLLNIKKIPRRCSHHLLSSTVYPFFHLQRMARAGEVDQGICCRADDPSFLPRDPHGRRELASINCPLAFHTQAHRSICVPTNRWANGKQIRMTKQTALSSRKALRIALPICYCLDIPHSCEYFPSTRKNMGKKPGGLACQSN